MGNSNIKEMFNNMMKQLEYLYLKSNNLRLNHSDYYYNIYGRMKIEELEYNLSISLNECDQYLKTKLNNANYTPNSILNEKYLDDAIDKIYNWKRICQNKYRKLFQKAENLFNKIKIKDQEVNEAKMDTEESYNKDMINYSWQQKAMLLDKQKVIQAQDLTLLNDNFGRALASLECYANRFSGKTLSNMFDYYNMFNLGNTQNMNELYKKAFVQTQIFKLAYDDYIKKYHNYTPPQNLDLGKIKSYLKEWMLYVDDDAKVIYQGMLNIFYSLNNSYFDKKFRSTSQKYKNAKMDPKKICCFASGVYYYNHQRCEEAKSNYMKNGQIVSSLQINQNYKDDKNAIQLQQNIMNNKESFLADSDMK